MITSILVLGATGNLGGEVVRQLATKGFNVRAGVRQPIGADQSADPGTRRTGADGYHHLQRVGHPPAAGQDDRSSVGAARVG